MRHEKVKKEVTYTCDYCAVQSTSGSGWYPIEEVSDIGLRLFEGKQGQPSVEARHLLSRKLLDFCGLECARKYVVAQIDEFLAEVKPPKMRKRV